MVLDNSVKRVVIEGLGMLPQVYFVSSGEASALKRVLDSMVCRDVA